MTMPRLSTMPASLAPLFRPFSAGPLTLRNRIVMAPMTRMRSPQGVPGDDVAAYYGRRAEADVGLIVTEGTMVNTPVSSMNVNVPNFFGDALAGWAKVVEAVHAAGGRIMPQLWHVGITRDPQGNVWNKGVPSASPSGLDLTGKKVAPPMTADEIAQTIEAFATAAADAQRLGFDGVELHGAHGYLIDQFLWEKTNRRSDGYGGDIVGRARFAIEIVQAVRRRCGGAFPVVLRLSQWKGGGNYDARLANDPAELARLLEPLADAGVSLFHMSARRYWDPAFDGSPLTLAGWAKKITGKPAIAVGSVGLSGVFAGPQSQPADVASLDQLLTRLDANEFDLIAVGRALLGDPLWARKIHEGRTDELRGYDPAMQATYY